MTLICIRDGVVAADTAAHRGSYRGGSAQKLVRSQDGAIGGACGSAACAMVFQKWFRETYVLDRQNGMPIQLGWKEEDFSAVWLELDGSIWHMEYRGMIYTTSEKFSAHGSDEDIAIGAMLAGASAEVAVRLCIEHTAWIGGDVQVERLEPVKTEEPEMTTEQAQEYESVLRAKDGPLMPGWQERMGLR